MFGVSTPTTNFPRLDHEDWHSEETKKRIDQARQDIASAREVNNQLEKTRQELRSQTPAELEMVARGHFDGPSRGQLIAEMRTAWESVAVALESIMHDMHARRRTLGAELTAATEEVEQALIEIGYLPAPLRGGSSRGQINPGMVRNHPRIIRLESERQSDSTVAYKKLIETARGEIERYRREHTKIRKQAEAIVG